MNFTDSQKDAINHLSGPAIFIFLVLELTFTLVIYDKLDNSAFTFVVGTIVGYLFAMTKIILKTD